MVKNLPCRAGDTGSISGPQKIPHATEKLSLYTANTESRHSRAQRSRAREAAKAGGQPPTRAQALLTTSRESLQAAKTTQGSQKEIKLYLNKNPFKYSDSQWFE